MTTRSGFLLVFMRFPEPGKVKTRLAPVLGPEDAARVYEKLLRRTLGVTSDFKSRNPDVRILLFHTPGDSRDGLEAKFSGPWEFRRQVGPHLGLRMENAFLTAFSEGAGKVLLIGSDLADIDIEAIEDGFGIIGKDIAVLGPASDGGFYLIGLAGPCPAPFQFGQWGTGDVFSRTVYAMRNSGFRVRTVKTGKDVDRPEDVFALESDYLFNSRLSVIIPTLGKPGELRSLLEFVESHIWPGDEIVVVGPGPMGDVRQLSASTLHVSAPKGRGIQQNAGARIASGDIFFFLHDDTFPPREFPYLIRKTCLREDVAVGCFELAFVPSNRKLDLIAHWANIRTALFGLPYGDQGLFCRRDMFEKVGGFRRSYLMEDVELVRACRKKGRLAVIPRQVHTSPGRYLTRGVLSASLQNHAIMLLSMLGGDEKKLYSLYYGQAASGTTNRQPHTDSRS